jgi:hypothetical protein
MSTRKLTMDVIRAAAERLKNWGRWGGDDEIGTLNFTAPEDIVGPSASTKPEEARDNERRIAVKREAQREDPRSSALLSATGLAPTAART